MEDLSDRDEVADRADGGPLAESLALSELTELLPDAIVLADESGEIVHANPQAEELFGYPHGELAGVQVEELIPAQLRDAHERHRAAYLEKPRKRPMGTGMPLLARRRDGTTFPADISLSATGNGRRLVFTAIRDATDRIEAEREWRALEGFAEEGRRQQARRLESLGQLAGGMAHDFNNILASILMSADLALENGLELADALREVREAAEHGADLAKQVLLIGRDAPESPEPVSVGSIVTGLLDLLRRTLGAPIKIETRIEDDDEEVLIDRAQLEQVILNLAINARDAMPDGGVLTITTEVVDADAAYAKLRPGMVPGRYVSLIVEDTGTGMTPDQIQHAFEPFYTTKDEGEGTGLGLATAYGVIRRADGFIGIYSEPGTGTSVKTYLPIIARDDASPARSQGPVERADESLRGSGERVLVVEDREDLRTLTARLLEANGYDVHTADCGRVALELLRSSGREIEVDAIVCDMVMPEMSGTELSEQLAEAGYDVPIVFMSGYTAQFAALGEDVLRKPFSSRELLQRVHRALRSRGGPSDGA